VTDALAWVPGWAGAVAVLLLVAVLARHALRQVEAGGNEPFDEAEQRDQAFDVREKSVVEHEYV
jgi:hypothetical protein